MFSKGIGFILLATFSFSIMNLIAKDLSSLPAMQVVFFRAFGTFVLVFPYMLYKGVPIIGNNPKWLCLRAGVGLISLSTFFLAIQMMPLGSAISIRYLGPIFAAFLAYLFLKEKITGMQWLCFFLAFMGVLMIKGFDIRIDNYGFLLIMISAVTVGVVFVLIRYLGDKEHYLTIINYFMAFCVVASLFFFPTWEMPMPSQYFSILSIGVFGLIGQVFMTRAFQLEETSVLAPFKYTELIFALVFTYFIYDESYTLPSIIGMFMIIGGMLLNVYFKSKQKGFTQ